MIQYLTWTMFVLVFTLAVPASGQSSSLFVPTGRRAPVVPGPPSKLNALSPAIAGASFVAVGPPAVRKFAIHDLVTVIVRESISNDAESTLETENNYKKKGKINAIPRLTLRDLLNLQLKQSDLAGGAPQVNVELDNKWGSDGKHGQRNTFTARITARIIDVKPNGTLVLEARKRIVTDSDSFTVVVTGICRNQDIAADNTILSEKISDLSVMKHHSGELRKAAKKGLLTKIMDVLFNF